MTWGVPGGGKPNPYMIETAGRLEHAARTSQARPAAYGTRLQRTFARLGVGVGLVAGIVPGILLYRRYRSWRTGERPTPGASGPIGATAFWLLVGAALWSGAGLELVAVIVVLVGLPPSLVVASRG